MKAKLSIIAVLATVLASPAFAAPRHLAPVRDDTLPAYGDSVSGQYAAHHPDVVTFGSRVVGEDPDQNIRTQLLHDPEPSEY